VVASKIYTFAPTIPAGTQIATPVTVPLTFPVYQVDRIEIKVPHGPNGTVGFAITMGGENVLPYQGKTWFVEDDADLAWDLDDLPTSGAWALTGYNLGLYPHTIYLRFLVETVPVPYQAPTIIPTASLTSDS
jgi:hypothetical protein